MKKLSALILFILFSNMVFAQTQVASSNGFVVAVFLFFCGIILISLIGLITERNKNKRKAKLQDFESSISDFDISDKFGNDRSMVYYDKSRHKIMVVAITTKEINKYIIDDVVKSGHASSNGNRYVVDNINKNLIVINTEGDNIIAGKISYRPDKYDSIKLENSLYPQVKLYLGSILLVDEQYGQILSTNFINNRFPSLLYSYPVPHKNRKKYFTTINLYQSETEGVYALISDDMAKQLIVMKLVNSPKPLFKAIKYEDIINVSYVEDGHTLSSKSTSRTVGGAILGGVIAGGAGAVVGGLTSNEKQTKVVSKMSIKLLLRSSEKTSFTIVLYDGKPLKTKDVDDSKKYELHANNATNIKDLVSVIIDKIDREQNHPRPQIVQQNNTSVADELMKLAKLKEQGIITEDEFMQQKKKLLG